ncbi:hypothetical protein Baya_8712 [Bagarius yarrelli]|uniref:Uncharacterized protein n=1 Tax=Bagarius yarrelli TaxID=175774 RepID=A0A556U7V3_BAGYA|nr:hypothetical protein Baya_8712 [Bagarius yarrelli]
MEREKEREGDGENEVPPFLVETLKKGRESSTDGPPLEQAHRGERTKTNQSLITKMFEISRTLNAALLSNEERIEKSLLHASFNFRRTKPRHCLISCLSAPPASVRLSLEAPRCNLTNTAHSSPPVSRYCKCRSPETRMVMPPAPMTAERSSSTNPFLSTARCSISSLAPFFSHASHTSLLQGFLLYCPAPRLHINAIKFVARLNIKRERMEAQVGSRERKTERERLTAELSRPGSMGERIAPGSVMAGWETLQPSSMSMTTHDTEVTWTAR